jgi:hypothetical protein
VVAGSTITFAGVTGTYSDGGGGGGSATYGSRSAGTLGSGGGGGREPLYTSLTYNYGYNGTDGVGGIVIIRWVADSDLPDNGGGEEEQSGGGGGHKKDNSKPQITAAEQPDFLAMTGLNGTWLLTLGLFATTAIVVGISLSLLKRRRSRL